MTLILSKNRFGRIVLHLLCWVHDGNFRWHWAGISRELHARGLRIHRVLVRAVLLAFLFSILF
jgi:hypothetical protein